MRMMVYGCSADSIDGYTGMGKSSYIFTGSNLLYFDVAFLLKRRAAHLNA
jgi:hypothetical protein